MMAADNNPSGASVASSAGGQVLALHLLQQLEQATIGDRAFSAEQQYADLWRGFVFEIDGWQLAVAFDAGYNIVACGDITRLPLSKPWLSGMTNIRGEVYTVVDIAIYLGKPGVVSSNNANLLLLPDQALKSALLLESKINLRSFSVDMRRSAPENFDRGFVPYLSTVLHDDETQQSWGVFDLTRLIQSDEFRNVGIH